MTKYHYTESGLSNVYIEGLEFAVDDDGDEVIHIPFVAALHVEIVRGIVLQKGTMGADQIRFVRTELGMTQSDLGSILGVTGLTVGRWEREECPMDKSNETLLRKMAAENLLGAFEAKVEELAQNIGSPANDNEPMTIMADGERYSLAA